MRIKKLLTVAIGMALCLQTLPAASLAANVETEKAISGNGVKVVYNEISHEITLYRTEGADAIQMSKPAEQGYPIVNNQPVQDFVPTSCTVDDNAVGLMGTGDRMTIISQSASTGLTRTYVMETSDAVVGAIYTTTSYQAGDTAVTPSWFVDNMFELFGAQDRIWSYSGGGEGPIHVTDTLQKIDLTDTTTYNRENVQDYTAAAIPVSDIYIANGGIAIGDASSTRREVHAPVHETIDSASISIKWPGRTLATGAAVEVGQSFVVVHKGDYYNGLRGYKNAMEYLGLVMQTDIPDRCYVLRWDAWGWGFNWTIEQVISELDFLKEAGVKQIAIDDGWYNHAGDWKLNPRKFPNGDSDMIRLVDAIHERGMTALLWWRPCDGGRDSSPLYQEHPEYYVMRKDGKTAKLGTSGVTNTDNWSADMGYALCPGSEGAVASQVDFVNRAMNTWGFDGFKGDYVWSMPKCYNPDHNHPYPEDSTERQAEFYRATYEAMVINDPEVFNLLCNCGVPLDYYSLPYMTQAITADPTSVDMTRTRFKAYKALLGDYYPVSTDHNKNWYSTAVGTGSLMIEKTSYTGTAKETYVRWLDIANTVELHKGRFIGDLYSYGFDAYETYVVEKDGVMHYAFYRDGVKCAPDGYPDIELKGLDPDKMYRVVDYVNNRIVATNLMGDNAVFSNRFAKDLLVKAVEITEPDDPSIVDPDWGYTIVDDRDDALVYTGTWHDDSNPAFKEGTARYTDSVDSAVEYTFFGTDVRWYGQRDTNFGTAEVYLDGELKATIDTNGSAETGALLFEALALPAAEHTIKIVNKTKVIDIDYIAYKAATPDIVYDQTIDALSDRITYTGPWQVEHSDSYYMGNAMSTTETDSYAEFTFRGTAIRWYGTTMTDYGIAWIYLDDELVKTVFTSSVTPGPGQLLLELTGLTAGEHTLRIVHKNNYIDLDYLTYASLQDPKPEPETHFVDDRDPMLHYTGAWQDDENASFYNGTARYTTESGASVAFAFSGSAIRWYGQRDINFGTAKVYIDDELIETVNTNGAAAAGQLLFEKADLLDGAHIIRIECESPVIDIDYLSYEN